MEDLSSLPKNEASTRLFGQINWSKLSFVDHPQVFWLPPSARNLRRSPLLTSRPLLSSLSPFPPHSKHTITWVPQHQLLERSKERLDGVLSVPSDAKKLAEILMSLADASDLAVQQYAFTRIEEILGLGSYIAEADSSACGVKNTSLFMGEAGVVDDAVFLKALENRDRADAYVQKSASLSLACLMSDKPVGQKNVVRLLQWISTTLQSAAPGGWETALPALAMISRKEAVRELITKSCLALVVNILKRLGVNGNAQQLYDLTVVLWTLSLVRSPKPNAIPGADDLLDLKAFLSSGIVNLLVDLVAAAPSRKVTRIAVAALVNLASREVPDILMEMFSTNLQKLIDSMIQSNSYKLANDPEFEADVKSLHDVLVKNYRELSTYDRWATEVLSGNLRWGIVHTEKFWRENFKSVELNEFSLLKALIQCLQSSDVVSSPDYPPLLV